MNTENFDDAFRRKVEGYHPPFRDDEIDRIQGYVNKHIPLSFWQRFGHTIGYSVGAIVIISLLISTLYQANENKILLNKISDLDIKLEQKQANTPIIEAPNGIVIEKIDTIYVVKHIKKDVFTDDNSRISDLKNEGKPELSFENKDSFDENMVLSKSEKVAEQISKKENKSKAISIENQAKKVMVEVEERNKIVFESGNKSKLLNDTQSEKTVLNSASDMKNNHTENVDFSNKNGIIKRPRDAASVVDLKDTGNSKNSINQLIISSLKSKNYKSIDVSSILDLSNCKSCLPQYIAKPKEKSSVKFPSIAMPNLKYRIGLGTNFAYNQAGTSILTDILFAKRWSVTTGVNISFLGTERFRNEEDFKRNKNQNFRDQYTVNVPIGNPIENIETHQLLFNIPLYLNYRYPLRKNFTALFITGTDLDFHLQQFTSYSHFDFSRDDKQALQEKITVKPFNNWLISVGVEKRWNHFSLQFSPYFSTKFKNIGYRKDDSSFGFKLNGFYRLSR